ncbi:MAG: metal-sensing transcriptional repressor [Anaerolineales bacterium]|nr:metal-sensing transcriptional repressor [Anaerolineales bacterium]
MREEKREDIMQRLRCIEGHTRGVVRMLETEADCVAVMRQIKAIQGALAKVTQLILHEKLTTHLSDPFLRKDPELQEKLLLEFADLLTISRTS